VSSWQIILPWVLPMAILLVASGLMSGSEAALFSLRRRDLKQLQAGGGTGKLAADLLANPERLLSGILFWNLLVNMTYFAMVGIVGGRLERSEVGGTGAAVTFTLANLLIVIFFSEMLPKSLAVLAPRRIASLCSLPLTIAIRILRPVLPVIRLANLATRRLIWPGFQPEPEIDLEAIGRAIDLGTGDTALAMREQSALKNLVQLADLRVDECMRPRSSLTLCSPPILPEAISRTFDRSVEGQPANGYLLVTEPGGDHIVGSLNVEQLRPSQLNNPTAMIEPVGYVPWSSNVSGVLDLLQRQRISVAVVVNEFGDTIGMLSIEDIVQQILTGRFEHHAIVETT
jgi:putative hemolysin